MNKDIQYKLGISSVPMRIFGTSEVHNQYKIWSTGKAHHQVLEKGALIVKYTGQIFPAFDELYLLIISVFNTTGNVMNFLS